LGPGPRRHSRRTPPVDTRGVPAASAGPSASGEVVRAHAWVAGRVQGVGFRVFALDHAHRLGLSGFVRNLPDRRVEIVAEGPAHGVEVLLNALGRGPTGARVTALDVTWEEPRGQIGFSIRDDARA
jgi:acylphosphatase